MQLAILLYDRMTALDAIGPYEVLQAPGLGIEVRFVAREKGMKRTDFGRLGLQADYTLDETPRPDILLVPGTAYPDAVMGDPVVLDWIAKVHQTTKWTTSVCTGALGLGAAGVLKGLKASTDVDAAGLAVSESERRVLLHLSAITTWAGRDAIPSGQLALP